jgi:glycogen operon protein
MTRRDWQQGEPLLGMFLNGRAILLPGPHGEQLEDDSFVLLFNAHAEDRLFKLPRRRMGARWELELTTADPNLQPGSVGYDAQAEVNVTARSITILKRVS